MIRAGERNEWDVIVLGAGTAGLCAAISARESGAERVAVVEKLPIVGGHGLVSSGSVAVAFRHPESSDPLWDVRKMISEMASVGGAEADVSLVRTLAEDSEMVVHWLESFGVRWNRQLFRAVGSLSARNISTGSPQAGYDYVQALVRRAKALGVEFMLSTRAVELIMEQGCVRGVKVLRMRTPSDAIVMPEEVQDSGQAVSLSARAGIIATGGFGANVKMRSRWDPSIPEVLPTTANPHKKLLDGATGDGIVLAEKAGAGLTGMEYIQVIPFSGGRLLDYIGGEIWVNGQGRRFVYEGLPFRELRTKLSAEEAQGFWAVSDSQTRKGASLGLKLMEGTVKQADSVKEMARGMGVSYEALTKTLERWNESVRRGVDYEFNMPLKGSSISIPPFFYGRETWSVHFTCGGVRINSNSEVLSEGARIIHGLFAAGEVTGGIHGQNRLGGNSMTDTFVFGRRAGLSAAGYVRTAQRRM